MIRVLQISMGEAFGGIEKLELEYLKYMSSKINLNVLTPSKSTFKQINIDNVKDKIIDLDISRKTFFGRIVFDRRLYIFLKKNKYDIVHINSSAFFFSLRVLLIAKICKVKKIVVHSHSVCNINKFKKIIIKILNPFYRSMVNEFISCSKEAEKSLLSNTFISKNKVKIIKNGIEIDKYKFDINKRKELINKYKLQNKIVYGHIGSMKKVKNQSFLIDLFYEIQKKQENSILLLIGDGEMLEEIKNKVKQLKIDEKVLFLGFRNDVNELLNCMDIFIFPSLYEGLGISVIESQTNGLITYCSNNVPNEANITSIFKTFNLDNDIKKIVNEIINEKIDIKKRNNYYKDVIKNGYDIKDCNKELEIIYKNLLDN